MVYNPYENPNLANQNSRELRVYFDWILEGSHSIFHFSFTDSREIKK